ncbi:10599_t:CDS:1, partial [Racocetra persica]
VPDQWNKAVKQIQSTQVKQKEQHDRCIKIIPNFQIGDKVLLFNAAHQMS